MDAKYHSLAVFLLAVVAPLNACTSSATARLRPPPTGVNAETWQKLSTLLLEPGAVPPHDPTNSFDQRPEAIALGQKVFFDTGFAGPLIEPDHDGHASIALGKMGETGKIGCVSCHDPAHAFSDGRSPGGELSLGASWTSRRAPSLIGVAYGSAFMWDGRHDALWNQVFTPFENAREINSGRLVIALRIAQDSDYRQKYEELFGPLPATVTAGSAIAQPGCTALDASRQGIHCHGKPGDGADFDALSPDAQRDVTRVLVNVGKSVAAYLRQITCGRSSLDDWIEYDDRALSDAEVRGAVLFAEKAQCINCHSGPQLTDQGFHNIGVSPAIILADFLERDDPGALRGIDQARASPLNTASEFSDAPDQSRVLDAPPDHDLGAFKTPSLRCVPLRGSLFHTGQVKTLDNAVRFFNRGGDMDGFMGHNELQPLSLSDSEVIDLVSFLESLVPLRGEGTQAEYMRAPQ